MSIEDAAARLLARRPLTESELRRRLERGGHPRSSIRELVERFGRIGYLNDGALAEDYIVARAARDGRARLLAALERRGVAPEVARAAWERAVARGDVDPRAALRRRVDRAVDRCGGQLDARSYRRVYNALLRAGFDAETTEAELAPFLDHGIDDDVR